jgi:chaperonin GroEL
MSKMLEFDEKARRSLERGITALANAVTVTIGPAGRNVVIDKKFGVPTITNDGVTIAREVELDDPYENLGAQLIKEAATKTNDIAGDGTTTATVLARAMVREGLRNIVAGAAPVGLGIGIAAAVDAINARLTEMARPVDSREDIAAVATVSAQDAAVGELIGEAMDKVGKDGVITVEESATMGLELELTEGMRFDKGYLSPHMATDPQRMESVLDNPYVLVHEQKISAVGDLLPLLELVVKQSRSLLVIAEDVEGEALSTLVVNRVRGRLTSVAVKAPGFGDRRKATLQDIAVLTGAQVVSPEVGLKLDQVGLEVLGTARRVVITADDTTVVDGGGTADAVAGRVSQLRAEIEATDSDWDREKLQERLAKLSGGICIIRVGAATEVEMKERKHRLEDAISAARAAAEEGIIAGGGAALVHASSVLEGDLGRSADEATGVRIVRAAIDEPLRWIAHNAGYEGSVVVAHVRESTDGHTGFNAASGEYGDLVAAGVIDPVKVTRSAVANAASIARMVLTTETLIVDKPQEPVTPSGGRGHSHGGHGHSH